MMYLPTHPYKIFSYLFPKDKENRTIPEQRTDFVGSLNTGVKKTETIRSPNPGLC